MMNSKERFAVEEKYLTKLQRKDEGQEIKDFSREKTETG